MEKTKIYETLFKSYNKFMEMAGDDGVKVINCYEDAINRMEAEGEYGSELHMRMNMWILSKTLKKLKSLTKSIKEYGLMRGDWNGKYAMVLVNQFKEMKPEIVKVDGYSKATSQKYMQMCLNCESVSTRLFGLSMLFDITIKLSDKDYISYYANKYDVDIIKKLLNGEAIEPKKEKVVTTDVDEEGNPLMVNEWYKKKPWYQSLITEGKVTVASAEELKEAAAEVKRMAEIASGKTLEEFAAMVFGEEEETDKETAERRYQTDLKIRAMQNSAQLQEDLKKSEEELKQLEDGLNDLPF